MLREYAADSGFKLDLDSLAGKVSSCLKLDAACGNFMVSVSRNAGKWGDINTTLIMLEQKASNTFKQEHSAAMQSVRDAVSAARDQLRRTQIGQCFAHFAEPLRVMSRALDGSSDERQEEEPIRTLCSSNLVSAMSGPSDTGLNKTHRQGIECLLCARDRYAEQMSRRLQSPVQLVRGQRDVAETC